MYGLLLRVKPCQKQHETCSSQDMIAGWSTMKVESLLGHLVWASLNLVSFNLRLAPFLPNCSVHTLFWLLPARDCSLALHHCHFYLYDILYSALYLSALFSTLFMINVECLFVISKLVGYLSRWLVLGLYTVILAVYHLNCINQYRCGFMDNFWIGIVLSCRFNLRDLNKVAKYPDLNLHTHIQIHLYMHIVCVCASIQWSPSTKARYRCKVGIRHMMGFGLGPSRKCRKKWAESVYKNWRLVHPSWQGSFQ